jgi:hypothetical protein
MQKNKDYSKNPNNMKAEIIDTKGAQLENGDIIIGFDPAYSQFVVKKKHDEWTFEYSIGEMKTKYGLTDKELNRIANLINPF